MANRRLPAEWEKQGFVQLTWPHPDTEWYDLPRVLDCYVNVARTIEKYEALLIVCRDKAECLEDIALRGWEPSCRVRFTECPLNDTWARDHGFLTLMTESGPRLLDFQFNGWGAKFPAELDNAINRHLYDEGRVRGQYVDCLDFVLEGGSIESDGQGTIFTTTGCLMAPHRNQSLTKDEIEARLLQTLCAKRIVWIDHGHLVGDDTDGHIDTLVRICPDDTLLYMSCDDPQDEQYEDLRLMAEELRQLRTLDGRPYRLMALPSPRPIYDDGDRLPATYANFLIINGAVLVPTYAQPDLDSEACRIIGQAFPDREIVPIDSRSIIRQHGSIHCCTMQFPNGTLVIKEG